ncbi:AMP-binding protein [uncultured Thermomonospora sp.]|uniref:AMP-binding protein n=1 Tax=uncultured Thermomonospora sp. TaxID=671175 RepID=UPI00259AF6B7|nr:AMP-binding protein [uncultured Thermomonospora sp.]
MLSTMQDARLQIRRLLEHGAALHASATVDTAAPGGLRRVPYARIGADAAALAHALGELGVGEGDRVGTFMWNNAEHLTACLAVPSMGAVLHPLDARLPGEQIVRLAEHAEDRVLIADEALLPHLGPLLPQMKTVEHVIVNRAGGTGAGPAVPSGVTVHEYAALLDGRPPAYPWPDLDERAPAAICYAGDGSGAPKGVVHSHRSIYLHALSAAMPDAFGLSSGDKVLAVVPPSCALGWGLPYLAFLTGASLAMPDRFQAPQALAGFIAASRPTKGAAPLRVWRDLLAHIEADPDADLSSLTEVFADGRPCSPDLLEGYERRGVTLLHVWGAAAAPARPPADATGAGARHYRLAQGRLPASVQARLVGPDGAALPHDDFSVGELQLRGPWIAGSYHRDEAPGDFHDGWLRTGETGRISADGYLTVTGRLADARRDDHAGAG